MRTPGLAAPGGVEVNCPRCGHDPGAIVVGSWTFTIPIEVESLNAHRVNAGAKWQQAAYRKRRDAWQQWMRAGRLNHKIPTATSKRRVTLTRLYNGRQRAFDDDNLSGGCKPIVDAMVSERLVVGDDAAGVELGYLQVKAERVGLVVLIEELK